MDWSKLIPMLIGCAFVAVIGMKVAVTGRIGLGHTASDGKQPDARPIDWVLYVGGILTVLAAAAIAAVVIIGSLR